MPALDPQALSTAIGSLGLGGRPVCVHASLRSFGARIVGGPGAVIDAFLAEGCTLMTPAFSDDFAVWPPVDQQPRRNGWNYDRPPTPYPGEARIYDPACTEVTVAEMGALSTALAAWPGRRRGDHPLLSFVAVGPLADALIAPQLPLDVFAPFRALTAQGGSVLLIGVGLTSMTLIHHAEAVAGRRPFRRWANGPDGRSMQVEAGGCSNGFAALEPHLGPLARETTVGASRWRAFPVEPIIVAAAAAIRAQPTITVCGNPGCERCRDAVLGGPLG